MECLASYIAGVVTAVFALFLLAIIAQPINHISSEAAKAGWGQSAGTVYTVTPAEVQALP